MLLDIIDGTITEQYAEFDLGEYGKYLYRIDIVRNGTYEYIERPEQLLLNDERVYYIERDNPDRLSCRTIDFAPIR